MAQHLTPEADDDYKNRYVAYLDLLGFKAQVDRAENSAGDRAKLREILHMVRDTLCENPAIGMRLTYFSDCILLSADRSPDGLWEMFQSITTLTLNLLQFDCLLRGALVAGGAQHGAAFIYGTAVSRAYEFESQKTIFPMTLVSSEVVADAQLVGDVFTRCLRQDERERHFLDYLQPFADYRPRPLYAGKVILDVPGRRIVDFICQRLNAEPGPVRAKAEWVQAYWNRTVAIHGIFDAIESGVTERYISGGPAVMIRRVVGP